MSAVSLRAVAAAGSFVAVAALSAQTAERVQARPGPMPTLPLTQLDERAPAADLDDRALTLIFARPTAIKDVLLILVRGTRLGVVPDPAISGTFVGELKRVTIRRALDLVLPPFGLDYSVDRGSIRVFRRLPETRLYDVNYIATRRTAEATIGSRGDGTSTARVSSVTSNDLFAELSKGVQGLLSEHATFNVDRQAGLLQVTDAPERLDRVAAYLDAVQQHVRRRVQIDARLVEVALRSEGAAGIDWAPLAAARELSKVIAALDAQGTVTMLASPRLVTFNNEPAIVRSEALTLSVTPQVGPDSSIMLNVTPVVSTPSIAESDTLARVGDGETVVVSGFPTSRGVSERKSAVELLLLITPKVLP